MQTEKIYLAKNKTPKQNNKLDLSKTNCEFIWSCLLPFSETKYYWKGHK